MPAVAPGATRAGSGILRQSSRPRERAAMAAVGMSVMVCRDSTMTAPAMAPAAAAGAAFAKALIWGGARCRMQPRPAAGAAREMGLKMTGVAMMGAVAGAARWPHE